MTNEQANTDSKYQGWANYETWAVKLWIDNDEGAQDYWREQAESNLDDAYTLAQALKDEHVDNDYVGGLSGTVFSDLMGAALSEVDWDEIAESLISDAKESLAYDHDHVGKDCTDDC